MKDFRIVNGFDLEQRLLENGFTLYDGEEPMWASRIQKGEYITVSSDLGTVNIYEVPDTIDEDTFIKYLTGNESDYEKYLEQYCIYEGDDDRCNLHYALGIY